MILIKLIQLNILLSYIEKISPLRYNYKLVTSVNSLSMSLTKFYIPNKQMVELAYSAIQYSYDRLTLN